VTLLVAMVVLPAAGALLALMLPSPRLVLGSCVAGGVLLASGTGAIAVQVLRGAPEPVLAADGQLFFDPLSAYHALLVVGVFALSSIYACYYFAPRIASGSFDTRMARRFGCLWFLFLGSMLLTLIANNVGLMWVGIEATTVASALLVCLDRNRPAVRAAWNYLVMCSVAIALALLGVVVACAAGRAAGGDGRSVFLWTELRALAPHMQPGPLRLAFVFALVGFGTKAGLAPLHSWLPDAHGHAPTPVSAVLSGVLLNCALYCLSRFLPVVEPSAPGWAASVLVPFGILSMAVAAAFIVHERDVKRLLAFHSVEHMGIITLGLGFGAPAAALFHTFNHSVCKMLTFFCAGTLAQRYQSRDMSRMHGILRLAPLAGGGLVAGLLALIGTPPFSVFVSELWIARVGLAHGHIAAVVLFFIAAAVVAIAAFRHAIEMTWEGEGQAAPSGRTRGIGLGLVAAPLGVLLAVGIWMPPSFGDALSRAASMIGGGP
jgi:hydrogenase-4 component F